MLQYKEIFTSICRFCSVRLLVQCDKMSTANDCHTLPIVITQMIAQLFHHPTTANAWNYLKPETKLRQWSPPAAGRHWCACLDRCDHVRERGERKTDSWPRRGGFVWISPRVIILIIGGHQQCCTDTSDGQNLNQMQVYVYGGTASNITVQKVKDNRRNVC